MIAERGDLPDHLRKSNKKLMQHLYKIIGRLTPAQISQYDFLMNFGVSIDSKANLKKAVDSACDYNEF